ncbi:putative amino acid transporter [Zalerion maritima]|uniref:Amino acid transporter n=1 Tax=Zalerion maritima TaxID=339359 RepID=A0AAD5WRU5_9PEZI|nr:putative amino acid transporter [Zalerion maritima]
MVSENQVVTHHNKDDGETVASVRIDGLAVNASGHRDQLSRQYGIMALAGMALTIDNAWLALGSSISLSILNGGPPGLIFGLIVAATYYIFIGLSLSELASSLPTAGGVYHWASVAGGDRFGRMLGFFTGWINFYGWMFDLAALVQITANIVVSMYAIYHPGYSSQPWHVYIAYLIILWFCCLMTVFGNKFIKYTQYFGLLFVTLGGVATIVVLATMPVKHASNEFVWGSFEENNLTGWTGGIAFILGVLNGAFTIGTCDSVTHMSEELPHPRRDLPKAIMLQIGLGFVYAFSFAIALCYAITDMDALDGGINTYPLTNIYLQATANAQGEKNLGATFGLLFILLGSGLPCCLATMVTNSRTYWALARDSAVPLSPLFATVNENLSSPVPATLFVAIVATGLGAIPLGSESAFLALAGSFIILTSVSYCIPFVANMASRRKYFPPGPFSLGKWGYLINGAAVTFIIFFDVMFCFPFALPVKVEGMNWNSVILVGTVVVTAAWWMIHARKHYPGPKVIKLYVHEADEPEETRDSEAETVQDRGTDTGTSKDGLETSGVPVDG